MNVDIPGYYFDPEKKKYFKIEKSHTAPSTASWSSHNVKRRKRHDAEVEAQERRAKLTRRHIKRSRALRDPNLCGLLTRELGLRDPSLDGLRSATDVPSAIYAAKLGSRGSISSRDNEVLGTRAAHPECFWVGPSPGSAGRIFCSSDHAHAERMSLTPPRHYKVTSDGSLREARDAAGYSRTEAGNVFSAYFAPAASSMSYSEKEDVLLLSSHLAPTRVWMVGPTARSDEIVSLAGKRLPRDLSINRVIAAPRSSSHLSAVIGTNAGIAFVDTRRKVNFVCHVAAANTADDDEQKPRHFDVLAQSFHVSNPSILYAGLRGSQVYGLDTRTPARAVTQLRHASSVAQLSTLESNENHLIAAGPRSAMAIYDIRCLRRQFNLRKNQSTTPVLNFPSYNNDAHIQIGFAVDQGGRIVAAADSERGVGIYSLLSGRRLASTVIDAIRSDGIIKALQFQTLSQDRHPSLWVGLAGGVGKYSVL
ncbi:hypothetical protein F5X68DRAFT_263861 [Plectosphaerella plurivora]|uniref:Uncharacterized protein n=1 Tax=Plectosphaerella plurivora TaxID=936078 RepID=A0A9P8V6D9_9PEZI|nr:hypothetical protein F5X68DRAFT_263861 [Plectosphaerella plurivora]